MFLSAFLASLPGAIAQGIIWGLMAVGVYITYRVLDVADLTVDGTMSLGGSVLVVCVVSGVNIYLTMVIAFLAGCIAGVVTGLLHTKFGIPAILAGILTQLALYSVNLKILGRSNQPLNVDLYPLFVSLRFIPKTIIVCLAITVCIIAVLYWFFGTELGHAIRATGCNRAMAKANGINTSRNTLIGLLISNGIVAVSGALLSQFQGFADVNMGRGAIVTGLAAVIIGDVLLGRIFKNFALRLFASVIGGVVYYVVITLVINLGMNTDDMKLFSAMIVALFLGIPYWKSKIAEKKIRPAKEESGNA